MKKSLSVCVLLLALPQASWADNQINDDLIVRGSECVGQDCVLGENFSFETLRLKENNTRLRFVDTSNTGSFPSVDWELVANDSNNGGRNRFSVENVDTDRELFTLEDGAPSYSLYVNDNGHVGLGTQDPQKRLHLTSENSPAIRIEQTGSGGFPNVSWDIQANEDGLSIAYNGELRLRLDSNGNLNLSGSVSASSIAPGTVPDYVFRDGYALMPLPQVRSFIETHGHLPEVPPAAQIERNGLNMTQMQLLLLKKVEELTLHTLAQQRQIDALQAHLQTRQGR
ncbi:MAG: hypothetical protein KDH88_08700 [Chromatiales bacterium]|nr:hypothetical protein [Chromatiales bacterium]